MPKYERVKSRRRRKKRRRSPSFKGGGGNNKQAENQIQKTKLTHSNLDPTNLHGEVTKPYQQQNIFGSELSESLGHRTHQGTTKLGEIRKLSQQTQRINSDQ